MAGTACRSGWALAALLLLVAPEGFAQQATGQTNAERLQPATPVTIATTPAVAADTGAKTAESALAIQDDEEWIGPWGEKRSLGGAVGEIVAINLLVWSFNEYIRGADFTQVSPRSWWENISGGFTYDDNHFTTNMFAHPYHGSLYHLSLIHI